MSRIEEDVRVILNGGELSTEELLDLAENEELEKLMSAANTIRKECKGDAAHLCAALNIKAGRCSENCKYCSQSGYYKTHVKYYDLISVTEIQKYIDFCRDNGVHNLGLSSSGGYFSALDDGTLLDIYRQVSADSPLCICGANGILRSEEEAQQLKDSGLTTYEHNLQTSRKFYPQMCSTHTYDERIKTIKYAQKVGLNVCSGGIIGMGESMEDRIEMAKTLRQLGITSVPINILNPVKGTPLGNNPVSLTIEAALRSISIMRFILPKANLIYGAGRSFMGDKCSLAFAAGMNGIVVGDFLTSKGNKIQDDIILLSEQGMYPVPSYNK